MFSEHLINNNCYHQRWLSSSSLLSITSTWLFISCWPFFKGKNLKNGQYIIQGASDWSVGLPGGSREVVKQGNGSRDTEKRVGGLQRQLRAEFYSKPVGISLQNSSLAVQCSYMRSCHLYQFPGGLLGNEEGPLCPGRLWTQIICSCPRTPRHQGHLPVHAAVVEVGKQPCANTSVYCAWK